MTEEDSRHHILSIL